MDEASLKQAILNSTTRNADRVVISCAQALRVAAEAGVDASRVGAICQTEGIKISECQLGCFGGRKHG